VVEVDEFVVFPLLYLRTLRFEIRWTLSYIMTTTRSGFLLTPTRMILNDPESPIYIHLKVRFPDDTPNVRRPMFVAFRADHEQMTE